MDVRKVTITATRAGTWSAQPLGPPDLAFPDHHPSTAWSGGLRLQNRICGTTSLSSGLAKQSQSCDPLMMNPTIFWFCREPTLRGTWQAGCLIHLK
jgi:hypothetical protein